MAKNPKYKRKVMFRNHDTKGAPETILGKALGENGWNKDTQEDELAKKEGNIPILIYQDGKANREHVNQIKITKK